MRKTALLLTSLLLAGQAPFAAAQDIAPPPQSGGASTESRMLQLAQILGTIQYVRTMCEPAEGEFWRERMMEMIRLEKPSVEQKNQLVTQFNNGYQEASTRFPSCTEEARRFASDTAREGEAIAQGLSDAIGAGGNSG